MKTLWLSLAAMFAAVTISAQDISEATKVALLAKESLQAGDYASALAGFKDSFKMASECGEEGLALVSTCKEILPKIMNALAKEAYGRGEYDAAVASLKESVEFSGVANEETSSLITSILLKKAESLLSAGKYTEAVEACEDALKEDHYSGMAALRLGQAYEALGEVDNALEAYKVASVNGEEKNACAKLGRILLERSIKELKANDFPAAIRDALASDGYVPSPQAVQVAGNASMLSGKRDDAIGYFEKYLNLAPDAENAGQVAYAVGALCKEAGYDAKAKTYLTKALADPKYGKDAKKALSTLK